MSLNEKLQELGTQFRANEYVAYFDAAVNLVAEEEALRLSKVGERAPTFTLSDPDFGQVSSLDLLADGPLVVSFYRGLWCGYCQRDLIGLEQAMPSIRLAHASAVAIAHGVEPAIRERLRKLNEFSFPLLDDVNGRVAEQFGIRWSTAESDLIDEELGMNLDTLRGTRPWILPMQARFVIGQSGTIEFAEAVFNYDQRSEPVVVLSILAGLREPVADNQTSTGAGTTKQP